MCGDGFVQVGVEACADGNQDDFDDCPSTCQNTFPVGNEPISVALGDLNGDGILDLATANVGFGSDNVSVLLGIGNGSFLSLQTFPVGDFPESVAIGDLNGNGILDLATANAGSDNVSVLIGVGNSSFLSPQTFPVGDFPESVAIGDLNGDGILDLATANFNSDNVSVLLAP